MAKVLDFRMFVQRVVVEVHLRIESEQIAGSGHDERIDLHKRRFGGEECVVERGGQLDELVDLLSVEADGESELPRFERTDADARLDIDLRDALGRFGGDRSEE